MQVNASNPLDLNKRQMHSGEYDALPPPDDGPWDQLQEQTKAKQQLQLIAKFEKSRTTSGQD